MQNESPYIPYDIYDSAQEIVIVLPLGWVKKESLKINIENYRLNIQWQRISPSLKENVIAVKEECYRGDIQQSIDLPPQIYFDKIHSNLSPENILTIIVPKAHIPEYIDIHIEN